MTHDSGNCAYVRRRLQAYVEALDLDCGSRPIEITLTNGDTLARNLELLRRQLAADFGGDFLAFRLRRGFAASEADFCQPAMERRALPSALWGHGIPPDMD